MIWSLVITAAAGGGEQGGFPAFDFWHWPSQVFWLSISFLVLYLFLSRAVLPAISDTLETRADRIQSDLDEAERLALKVAKLDESLEKTLAQARSNAKASEAEIKKELEAELAFASSQREKVFAEKLEQSDAVIDKVRTASDQNITEAAVDVAQAMVAAFGHKVGRVEIKSIIKSVSA